MKKIFLFQQPIYFVILLVATVTGCKKSETIYIRVQEPVARFSTRVIDPYGNFLNAGSVTYIDSNFYFFNSSDSGVNITYHWDFGDGATSTDKNPKHSYAKRGEYNVTLKVSNDNKSFDTLQQTLSVILGQQHISFGDGINLSPIAIEETSAKEFVLLASTGYGGGYHLFLLDSLLKQKGMKTFPAAYRLASMKATKDGNYIFTGSTEAATNNNELIKMTPDGSVLWKKVLSSTDSYYINATPTPDGGYAVIGSKPVAMPGGGTNYNTILIKTDANGNQQWQKLLDGEGMILTENSVAEQDGIIISGTKRGVCLECDSILIVKLDNAGNVLWKNSVLGGLNNFVWWNTRVAKLTNGNYAVSNGYTRGIFIFSTSGEFLDRKLAPAQVAAVTNSADGNIIVLQSESGNGNRMALSKLTLAGAQQWIAFPDGREKMQGGYSCCSSSWPVAISPLANSGTISIGYRMIYNTNNYNTHSVIVLLQLNEAGKQK